MNKKDGFIMKCWFCQGEMKWIGDFDFNEYELDGDGNIAILSCKKCEALAEFYSKSKDEIILNEREI